MVEKVCGTDPFHGPEAAAAEQKGGSGCKFFSTQCDGLAFFAPLYFFTVPPHPSHGLRLMALTPRVAGRETFVP